MKLIVISSPVAIADEPAIINRLFAAGLEILHLRKPNTRAAEIATLLNQINPIYYPRIALHHHHGLAEQFGISRLHFPEQERQRLSVSDWQKIQAAGYKLSTSVHQLEIIKILPPVFEYGFFSPVFTSISKPSYQSVLNNNYYLKAEDKPFPVIALGGISASKISQVRKMNFDGAALLGAIWQEPEKALDNFKIIQHACSQIALTC
ncbi:thiamine phosphate synthase [Adhaeribacter rhizoryzae]|uniref:Thiamine phosphate synthase n=1 Tax=Adhaeribacter rhizoryzae TaxID=2607907 RepID=A0A5M6D540_9BACT|nr:thiamine phosphate synthase [Adhaeribacter rhizoryzae]KAA5540325.1 thiamine phosphate synthase [Adhaeribacter rhizoryzae]